MTVEKDSTPAAGGRVGVLLIHGLSGSPAEMRFVAGALAQKGLTVRCPLLSGHGGTGEELKASSWEDWYESAERGLEELARECDRIIVGGLSTGAVLSLLLAADYPEKVQAIALYSPTLWLSGRKVPWYVPLFRLINIKSLANRFEFPVPAHVGIKDQRIREFIRRATGGAVPMATPGGAVLERRRLSRVALGLLGTIKQPALIVHARDDDYAGLDNAAYLQKQLGGPVDLTVLDDSYHMVTVDRQREVVVERTVAFAARIAAAPGEESGRARGRPSGRVEVDLDRPVPAAPHAA